MSASSYDNNDKIEWKEFDQYSFSSIHAASVDAKRKRNAKKRKGDFVNYDINLITETTIYPSEHIVSDNAGHKGIIKEEWLYEAVSALEDKLKTVLILKYWSRWLRSEIAEYFSVSEKTITNWKNKAFEQIRNYKERMINSDIRGP